MFSTRATNTRLGLVPHLRHALAGGNIAAPVALITKKRDGSWVRPDGNGHYLPKVLRGRFVHVLPGGTEVMGQPLDSVQRERLERITAKAGCELAKGVGKLMEDNA